MNEYTTIATIANLNTLYQDIRGRIDTLGDLYKIKGNISFKNLMKLESAKEGDVYNLIDVSGTPKGVSLSVGDNVACKKEFSSKSDNFSTHWFKVGGMYEIATDSVAGLVYTGTGIATLADTKEGKEGVVQRGLKMMGMSQESSGDIEDTSAGPTVLQAYVDIPIASENTYGVITNQDQALKGNKTLYGTFKVTPSESDSSSTTITGESITVSSTSSSSTIITNKSITVGNTSNTDGTSNTYTGTLNIYGTGKAQLDETQTETINYLGVLHSSETNIGTLEATGTTLKIESTSTLTANTITLAAGESGDLGDLTINSDILSVNKLTGDSLTLKTEGSSISVTDKAILNTKTLSDFSGGDSLTSIKTDTLTVPTLTLNDGSLTATNSGVALEVTTLKGSDGVDDINLKSINTNNLTVPTLNFSNAKSSLEVTNKVTNTVTTLTLKELDGVSGTTLNVDTLIVPTLDVAGTLYAETVDASNQKVDATSVTTFKVNTSLIVNNLGDSTSPIGTLKASTVDASGKTINVSTNVTATNVTATNVNVTTATADNVYSTSIGTSGNYVDSVTVTKLVGTGNSSTLYAKNINVGGSSTVSLTYTDDVPNSRSTAFTDNNTQGLTCNMNFGVAGHIYAYKVHNAVWNDLADAIEIGIKPEPGYCYSFDGEKYNKSTKYCDKGFIGIHSDTFGMIMGEKGSETELNVALAGFVLAYVDKEYPTGTPLTCTKEGYLTKIKKKDLIFRPQRIVATYWKSESKDKWNGVEVLGRKWVKVR